MTYWHLPRAFAFCPWEDWILCCHSCWPSTCPEGNLGLRMKHFVLQRNCWNRSSDSYFQELISSWAPKSLQMLTAAMKLRHLLLGRKVMTNLDSILKSRDITLPTKVHLVKALVFPVVMYGWELDHKESWGAKELILLTCGVGEDSWESLGLQGDPTSPFWRRSVLGFLWKEWCWSWNSSTLAIWCEELTP